MAKERIAQEILRRLEDFASDLEDGVDIAKEYNCRRVVLDLAPTPYDAEKVKKTRELLRASQAMFARFLGVRLKTVQAWEQGQNEPKDIACRFMDEIRRDPTYWQNRLQGACVAKTP